MSVYSSAGQPRKWPARPDDGVEQPPGSDTIAELHAIGDESFRGEVLGHGPENRFKELADEHHALTITDRINQLLHTLAAHARLQFILKVFLAEKVQAVAGNAAENGVQKPGGQGAAGQIGGRSQQAHGEHRGATNPALQKALAVPIEEARATKRADL